MGHGAEVEMPHDEHDPFVKRIALCVAIYAVILAIAGTGGKNAGKDMISEQIEASNTWSRYQAKAVREAIYINDLEKYELEVEKGGLSPEAEKKVGKSIERVKKKLEDYKKDKEEIMEKAKGHEEARDKAHKKDTYFDFAELLLQIAIVLASVAMLAKARWAFFLSMALVAVGILFTVNGYTLAIHIGFMEGH
jgi:hypothetical protein